MRRAAFLLCRSAPLALCFLASAATAANFLLLGVGCAALTGGYAPPAIINHYAMADGDFSLGERRRLVVGVAGIHDDGQFLQRLSRLALSAVRQ